PGERSLSALQARAFFASELVQAVGEWLLSALALPPVSRLAISGSEVLLLLPRSVQGQLEPLAAEAERRLLEGGAEAALALGWTEVTGHEIMHSAGAALRRARAAAATRPFGRLSAVDQGRLFAPWDPAEEEQTHAGEQWARQLRQATHLLVLDHPAGTSHDPAQRALAAFGRRVEIVTGSVPPELPTEAVRARLVRFGVAGPYDASHRAWAVRQPVPVALVSRLPLDLEEPPPEATALLALGLDGAGERLGDVLADAPLARLLDVLVLTQAFLTALVPSAARQATTQRLTPIATSTDSALLAAPPGELPRLTLALQARLSALTSDHPALRLSAGVALEATRQPAASLAAAEWALRQRAQRFQRGGDPRSAGPLVGRDQHAVAALDRTLAFEEFRTVWERALRLVELVTKRRVSPRLLAIAAAAGQNAGQAGRPLWQGAAALRQLAATGRLPEADLATLLNDLARPESAQRLALAARWAALALAPSLGETPHD
ncbi:MAG: hypothetical protein K6U89_15150, partial [Chloroflexi bacterium]|nr:hypothetical protein [Chloroflexota bacterium]